MMPHVLKSDAARGYQHHDEIHVARNAKRTADILWAAVEQGGKSAESGSVPQYLPGGQDNAEADV